MLNTFFKNIPLSVKLLIKFFLLELFTFSAYRLLFFLTFYPTDDVDISLTLQSFFFGMRFDNALLCYAFFIPLLLLFINDFFSNKLRILKTISVSFLGVVFLIYQFAYAADIPYYKQFGSHLNKNALLWKDNASFVLGFVFENSMYWGYLFVFLLSALITLYVIKKINKTYEVNLSKKMPPIKKIILVFNFLICAGLLVLGARGTVSQKTTMHEGFAVISSNPFINSVCLNPNYSFFKSLIDSKNKVEYVIPNDINESMAFTQRYLQINKPVQNTIDRLDTFSAKSTKPNIVLIIMESMSIAKMGYYNYPNLTPNLNAITKESIFFNHFFSSGIHTFNGLFSSTTGFPSLYSEHSLNDYTKTHFDGLGTLVKQFGYDTYFGTTHDSQFDNMEGFFRLNNFDHIINQASMPSNKVISTLGVPDHILFDELITQLNTAKSTKPFLSVLMTATDHGPWIIPIDINYKPTAQTEQQRCTQYADWAIGEFIAHAKKQSWFSNTVFLFVGDHGFSTGPYEMPITFNHVPFIIYQPNKFKADTISYPCYQPDITPTILGIIGENFTNKTFGVNVLEKKHPFVIFSADDKLGLVDSSGFFYYKTLSDNQQYLRKYINSDDKNYINDYPQKVDSFNYNIIHIFNTAEYLINSKYKR